MCETKLHSSIAKLLLGNGLGQIIQFSSILIFSRMYAPGEFGVLGQVQSYATVAAILCTLQLHLSIPLCKESREARSLVSAIITICYAVAAVILPFALWSGEVYVYALVLAICIALSNTFNSYLVFSGDFGKISRFYVFRSIAIVVVQVVLGLYGVENGLVWGAVGGEGLTALYLGAKSRHDALPMNGESVRHVLAALRERRSFALFGTMQELASVSAFYAPLFFFAHGFDNDVVGQYAMASRLVWAPVILFTGSLAQVLYHQFGQERGAEAMHPGFLKLPHAAYYVLLFAAPIVCLMLRDLIVFALGNNWGMAADMLPLVVAWGSVFVVSTPARVACRMLRQQKLHLLIDLGMLTGIALVFQLASASPVKAMAGILAVALVQNMLMMLVARRAMRAAPLKKEFA